MSSSASYVSLPRHPRATAVLVLGLLNTVCFAAAPVAWVLGTRVVREIDASGGLVGGRASAQAGRVLGVVGTGVLLAASVVWGLRA